MAGRYTYDDMRMSNGEAHFRRPKKGDDKLMSEWHCKDCKIMVFSPRCMQCGREDPQK